MSKSSSSSSSGGGGIGIVSLISGIYAYATIPALTGLKGAFGAAMIGMGTSLGAGIYALGGGLAGAAIGGVVGGALGMLGGKGLKGAFAGAVAIGVVGAIGTGIYGIPKFYGHGKDIVLNGIKPKNSVSQMIEKPANVRPVLNIAGLQ